MTINKDLKIDQADEVKSFAKLVWTEDISTNHTTIDQQHQHLFQLTNNLIDHADADVHSEVLNETIYDLLKYIDEHFTDEEAMLSALNYPKLDEHRKMHRAFTKRIARFCQAVVKGEQHVTEDLLNFLCQWLKSHTSEADQDYKNYV